MPGALLWRLAPYIAGLVLILGGLWFYGKHKADQGRAEIQAQWDQQRADQTAAALGTLQAAIERDAAERKALEESRARAADTLLGAVTAIRARVGSINQRLEEDRQNDPECRAWSDDPVRCPLPWVPDHAPGTTDNPGTGPDTVRIGAVVLPDTAGGGLSATSADQWQHAPVRGGITRPD